MSTPKRPSKPQALKGEHEPIAIPSLSASVVLVAPLKERTVDGYDYRVLLLKRNARSSTFVSAHVFPGGNVDPIDSSNVWDELYPESLGQPDADAVARMRRLRICAARECFEECGILLEESKGSKGKEIWAAIPESERKVWRDKVHDDGESFFDLFKLLSPSGSPPSRPALSSLKYRANWITPRQVKTEWPYCLSSTLLTYKSLITFRMNSRRFDTHFFITILEPSLAAAVLPSATSPDAVISDHLASADGQETFYLLAELAAHKSYATILDATAERQVEAFEPELKGIKTSRGDVWPATVLPGDPEHSQTGKLLALLGLGDGDGKRRHRTFVLMPTRIPGKKPPPGLTVVGCQRRGMLELLGPGWEDMTDGDIGEGGAVKL
ncbi:hypothetical protein RQP46_006930 [Phenoliferia psychrophenolica]